MGLKGFLAKILGADKVVGKVLDTGANITKTLSNKEQASRRLQTDMLSDNKLSKSIRPLIAIWAILFYSALVILGLFGIKASPESMNTLHTILVISIGFYYPARTLEKIMKEKLKDQKKDPGTNQDIT